MVTGAILIIAIKMKTRNIFEIKYTAYQLTRLKILCFQKKPRFKTLTNRNHLNSLTQNYFIVYTVIIIKCYSQVIYMYINHTLLLKQGSLN